MPPHPTSSSPELLAFIDWCRGKYAASTVSQYVRILSQLEAAGALTSEAVAKKYVEATWSASTWGLRLAAVRTYFRQLDFLVATEADARLEHGIDLTAFSSFLRESGLKTSTAYRYTMAASRVLGLLLGATTGDPQSLSSALATASDHIHDYAWRRYVYWAEGTGCPVPAAWMPPFGGHGFHTRVLIAVRTLADAPYRWPLDRLCESRFCDLYQHPEHRGVTLSLQPGGSAARTLHWLQPGRSGHEAFRVLLDWSKPDSKGRKPLLVTRSGGDVGVSLQTLRIALEELHDLSRVEQLATTGRKVASEPEPMRWEAFAATVEPASVDLGDTGAVVHGDGLPTPMPMRTPPAPLVPPAAPPHAVIDLNAVNAAERLPTHVVMPPPPEAIFGTRGPK